MLERINHLHADEDGAVSVDWVVLTAALVGLGLVIALGIGAAATDPAEGVGASLRTMEVGE